MKHPNFQRLVIAAGVALTLITTTAGAQDATASPVAAPAPAASPAVALSYGVPDILKLTQAKVGDDVIVAYIQNTRTVYSLDASQIVYLRQQGVSDSVVTTMLNQRTKVTATAEPAPSPANDSTSGPAPVSTATAQPAAAYVQTAPAPSVYVIPDTATYNYYAYYHQPYYDPYYYDYGWPFPVAFSFGFGRGYHGGGYHGGYGGGFHGHGRR